LPLRCCACTEILSAFEAGPVTFDWCESCGSLWVDPVELAKVPEAREALAKLGKLAKNPRYCSTCRQTVPPNQKSCGTCKKPTASCPVCRDVPLKAVPAGSGTFDACPRCHGLWIGAADLAELARSGELSVKLENALSDGEEKRNAGALCDRCGSALAGRTAWRVGRSTYCSNCMTVAPRGSGKEKHSPLARPGLPVLEILGRVLEFIEGGLPSVGIRR
jgi:Zn-finger nucleic acid-binding protein